MAQQTHSCLSMMRPALLLPHQVVPTSSNMWLLTQMKNVLNLSYTATYCAQPAIFGTNHVRIADVSQIADIIGPDGFTVVLIMDKRGEESIERFEIVATASVKSFGDGDVKEYFKWTKNIGGMQWADKSRTTEKQQDQSVPSATTAPKPEVTALGVHPNYQKVVALETEDLMGLFLFQRMRLRLSESAWSRIKSMGGVGIDLDALRQQTSTENRDRVARTVVLTCVRELGNEVYYEKRGYKTLHTGTVPVGMWDSKKECTMAYMEKQLL